MKRRETTSLLDEEEIWSELERTSLFASETGMNIQPLYKTILSATLSLHSFLSLPVSSVFPFTRSVINSLTLTVALLSFPLFYGITHSFDPSKEQDSEVKQRREKEKTQQQRQKKTNAMNESQ